MPHRPFLLAALACAALCSPLLTAAQTSQLQPPSPGSPRVLHVSGEGSVRVRPDVAILTAGVEATGPDLARVTRDTNARMRKLLAALSEAGVAEKDVQTTRHDVQVERPWKNDRPGPITGYTVNDEVRVTVRNLERLGPALDRVTAAGANALRGLTFEKDDPNPERARALAAAYAAARVKADALAKAAGVTLGDILQVGESGGAAPVPMLRTRMMRSVEAADAVGASVSPGELELTAQVDVVYAIR
jgi:uncharacterized protein YggE